MTKPPIPNARFDHVALAAPSLEELLPMFVDLLGAELSWAQVSRNRTFLVVELDLADGTKFELMQPTRGSTFFDSFFRTRPRGGLHHATFLVDDIDDALQACHERGLAVFGERRQTSWWHEFFIDPRSAGGALIQLACSPAPRPRWEPMSVAEILRLADHEPRE